MNPTQAQRLIKAKNYFDSGDYYLCDREAAKIIARDLLGQALHLRMISNSKVNDPQRALQHFNRALSCGMGKDCAFLTNAAQVFRQLRRFTDALHLVTDALKINSLDSQAKYMLGNVLGDLKQYSDAIRAYREGMDIKYDPVYLTNIGNCLENMGKREEAKSYHHKCVEELGGQKYCTEGAPFLNLASIALKERDYGYAEILYTKILGFDSTNAQAHLGMAHCLLIHGQWRQGWEEYRWRFVADGSDKIMPWKEWDGKDRSKRLLVIHEQGYGDFFLAARYLKQLDWNRTRLLCPDSLAEIIKQSIPAVNFYHHSPREIDAYIFAMDLPRVFAQGYGLLQIEAEWVRKKSVPSPSEKTIGFCWRGRDIPDPRRTIPFSVFKQVLLGDFTKVCLQADVLDTERDNFDKSIPADLWWTETANYMSSCDAIVTIDTSIANLAGSMGKLGIVLLPYASDWRWGMHTEQTVKACALYPSLTLVRQQKEGDWSYPIIYARKFIEILRPL